MDYLKCDYFIRSNFIKSQINILYIYIIICILAIYTKIYLILFKKKLRLLLLCFVVSRYVCNLITNVWVP